MCSPSGGVSGRPSTGSAAKSSCWEVMSGSPFSAQLGLLASLRGIERAAGVVAADLLFLEHGHLIGRVVLRHPGEMFAEDRTYLDLARLDPGHGPRDQALAATVVGVKVHLDVAHQLLGFVDPHVADGADDLAVTGDDRQPAWIAPGGHVEMVGGGHGHDLGMAVAVKLGDVAPRRPGGRADTVDHGVAR